MLRERHAGQLHLNKKLKKILQHVFSYQIIVNKFTNPLWSSLLGN